MAFNFASLGMTRAQGLTIGALVAILVGAIFYGQSGNTPANSDANVAVTPPASQDAARPASTAVVPVKITTHWPAVSRERMLQHNPFKHLELPPDVSAEAQPEAPPDEPTPDATAEAAAAEAAALAAEKQKKAQEILTEFQDRKVQMILRTGGKASAMIGNRLVHEGDIIGGIRIVSILPNGVLIEPEATGDSAQPVGSK